jgi:hypothetical protein
MALADELAAAAAAASAHGHVSGVLAAELQGGRRGYVVALGEDTVREWVVLDANLAPVTDREQVRETASIVVLCELAGELAGGGQLEQLRSQLAEVRLTEQPPGIEAAETAALELERAIGSPPVVASAGYLDGVGAAAARLEEALGEGAAPFATALAASSGTVQAFVTEVVERHRTPLR